MSKPADIGGKRLVSLAPENWAQWVTQLSQLQVQQMLDSDLQWVSRENDILLKVTSPETGYFLPSTGNNEVGYGSVKRLSLVSANFARR